MIEIAPLLSFTFTCESLYLLCSKDLMQNLARTPPLKLPCCPHNNQNINR